MGGVFIFVERSFLLTTNLFSFEKRPLTLKPLHIIHLLHLFYLYSIVKSEPRKLKKSHEHELS